MPVVVLFFNCGFVQSVLRSPLIVARAPSRCSMAPFSTDVRPRLAVTKLQSFEGKTVDMITGAVQNPANIPSAFIVTWFLGAVSWKSAKNQEQAEDLRTELKDMSDGLRGDISYICRRLDNLVFLGALGVLAVTVAVLRPALASGAFSSL